MHQTKIDIPESIHEAGIDSTGATRGGPEKLMRTSTVLISLPLVLVSLASVHAQDVRTGADAFGNWEEDAPGVRRHIKPADLPPPKNGNNPEEPDYERTPNVVEAPQGVMPDVPEGFTVEVFASVLNNPRVIRVAPNDDVFSASNVAAGMPEKTPEEIRAWEEQRGAGAAWGEEENRAVVRVFDPEGTTVRNYATGLRNCSGMAMQPGTDTLWRVGNERDHLGANVAPDFMASVQDGGFYGWPWYSIGGNEDPAHAGERPDLQGEVIVPEVLIQAHSSILDIVFYDADAVPAEYQGDAFAVLHGSWNRRERTGYKVIRIFMEDGEPTGVYEDFMTGFVLDDDRVWGRPAGIAVARDGSLLVSDDANGTIFRVAYEGSR